MLKWYASIARARTLSVRRRRWGRGPLEAGIAARLQDAVVGHLLIKGCLKANSSGGAAVGRHDELARLERFEISGSSRALGDISSSTARWKLPPITEAAEHALLREPEPIDARHHGFLHCAGISTEASCSVS